MDTDRKPILDDTALSMLRRMGISHPPRPGELEAKFQTRRAFLTVRAEMRRRGFLSWHGRVWRITDEGRLLLRMLQGIRRGWLFVDFHEELGPSYKGFICSADRSGTLIQLDVIWQCVNLAAVKDTEATLIIDLAEFNIWYLWEPDELTIDATSSTLAQRLMLGLTGGITHQQLQKVFA